MLFAHKYGDSSVILVDSRDLETVVSILIGFLQRDDIALPQPILVRIGRGNKNCLVIKLRIYIPAVISDSVQCDLLNPGAVLPRGLKAVGGELLSVGIVGVYLTLQNSIGKSRSKLIIAIDCPCRDLQQIRMFRQHDIRHQPLVVHQHRRQHHSEEQ